MDCPYQMKNINLLSRIIKRLFEFIRRKALPVVHYRGYYVSTVGRDEKTIREYIKRQEQEDKRQEKRFDNE